jgi:chemotaxis regulatin CheY-phosphate phosphatase CheZ
MLGKLFKRLTGIDKLEKTIADAEFRLEKAVDDTAAHQREAERARQETERAKEAEDLAKLTPKDRATKLKEPWVGVLNTHINKDNVRNGFFELDWNDHFVLKLKQEGYGFDGDNDEEIVDRWFRELCANVVVDGDFGGAVNTGVIDIQSVKRNNK